MRHHFTADFRKARQPAFDVKKSIFVEPADVARLQPTVAQNFCGSALRKYRRKKVGVSSRNVSLYRSISAAHFVASNGFGYVMMRTPSISGYQSVTVDPNV